MYTSTYSKQSFKFALLKQGLYMYPMVVIVLTPVVFCFLLLFLHALSLPLVLLICERDWAASCLIPFIYIWLLYKLTLNCKL